MGWIESGEVTDERGMACATSGLHLSCNFPPDSIGTMKTERLGVLPWFLKTNDKMEIRRGERPVIPYRLDW